MECWRIYKTHFEAAHYIDNERIKTDKCHTLHGHSYHLTVKVKGNTEDWLDFHTIKAVVEEVLEDEYDEKNLGDMSLEQVITKLRQELMWALSKEPKVKPAEVNLEIMETDKHGIEV